MYLPQDDVFIIGSDIQRKIVVHMARFDKVLQFGLKNLTLEHFTWGPALVLATVLFGYHAEHKRRPPFSLLVTEVQALLKSQGATYLQEGNLPELMQTLQLIQSEPDDGLDASWACAAIKKYCAQSRLADFTRDASLALQTGIGVDAVVSRAGTLSTGLEDAGDALLVASALDSSRLGAGDGRRGKVPVGLKKMDAAIGGGLAPGEMCLVAALQGVGKSNLMANFMLSAAYDGWYNLGLSLEMPIVTFQERILAMAACIPAMKFRDEKGILAFDEYEKSRIQAVETSDLARKLILADYSGRSCTVDEIVSFVGRWLQSLERMGVRDRAGMVFVDYINLIDVPGLKGDRDNLSPDVVKRTVDRLKKEVANAYGIRLYVASQTTSKAEGNQVLSRQHVAWGFHSVDAIDFGFGLAPKEDTRYQELDNDNGLSGQPVVDITTKGRQLVLSSFKARVGNTTAFTFYQAPTLRMYNNQGEYKDVESAVFAGGFRPLMNGS